MPLLLLETPHLYLTPNNIQVMEYLSLAGLSCQDDLHAVNPFQVPPDAPGRFLQLQSMLVVVHWLQGPTSVLGWQHANLPVQNLAAIPLSTVLERLRHRPSRHLPADTRKAEACDPDTETGRTTDTPECPGLGRPPSCAMHPARSWIPHPSTAGRDIPDRVSVRLGTASGRERATTTPSGMPPSISIR